MKNTTLESLEKRIEALEGKDGKTIQEIPAKTLIWGKTSDKEMNWDDAIKWCKEQGGRLPTLIELLQAYEDKVDGFQSSIYWSSTEYSATFAWAVYFSTGVPDYTYKNDAYAVRCVSDGL